MITIAIPTFNRSEKLLERLRELASQIDAETQIVIFDNGSTDGTCEALAQMDDLKFLLQRWPTNRGICRNFIRLFEEVRGDWIWMLSDDDPVRPDALEIIKAKIKENSSSRILAFKAQGNSISKSEIYYTLPDFLRDQSVFNLSYISGLVLSKEAIVAGQAILAPSSATMLPHVMLVLAALQKGYPVQTVNEEILVPQEGEHRVSRLEFLLGVTLLPNFFSDPKIRKLIAVQARMASRWMLFSSLAQVSSPNDVIQWKQSVSISSSSFAAYGVGLATMLCSGCLSPKDLKREFLFLLIRRLPNFILLRLGNYLALKTGQRHNITHRDALC